MLRRFAVDAEVSTLAAKRQVKAVISTETLGADGLIVKTSGIEGQGFSLLINNDRSSCHGRQGDGHERGRNN